MKFDVSYAHDMKFAKTVDFELVSELMDFIHNCEEDIIISDEKAWWNSENEGRPQILIYDDYIE